MYYFYLLFLFGINKCCCCCCWLVMVFKVVLELCFNVILALLQTFTI